MKLWLLILGMAGVTFLPRLLPLMVLRRGRLPRRLRLLLSYIPFAALGALIIPGGLTAVDGRMLLSSLGLAAALGTAVFSRSMVIPMAAAVLCVLGLSFVL